MIAIFAAMALSGASAFLGVALARLVWAEDLRRAEQRLEQAKEIDRIRSGTEGHLRDTIAALQRQVTALETIKSLRMRAAQ